MFGGGTDQRSGQKLSTMFGQPSCSCGHCGGSNTAGQQPVGGGAAQHGKKSQVLTFPDSKPPMPVYRSQSFNPSRHFNAPKMPEINDCKYQTFAATRGVEQKPFQAPQGQFYCPPMAGGSVEIVKIGEGPPLTWADLQRHSLHGGFPMTDDGDWVSPMQMQQQERQAPVQQPSMNRPALKQAGGGGAMQQEQLQQQQLQQEAPKRAPIGEYGRWSQRKKTPNVLELPSEFMIPPPSHSTCGMSCFCAQQQQQQQALPSLATTTAQTDGPTQSGCPQMAYQPMIMAPCYCGQCYTEEQWQPTEQQVQQQQQPIGRQFILGRQCSLPPASHHSPEQRTSYRGQRFY